MRKIFLFATIVTFLLVESGFAAAPGKWSEYEPLNDNAENGIDFSWKRDCRRLDDKACAISWKWWNRYEKKVRVSYRLHIAGEQGKRAEDNNLVLYPGESPEFSTVGEKLLQVQVGVEKEDVRGAKPISFEVAKDKRAAAQKEANKKEQIRRLTEDEKTQRQLNQQYTALQAQHPPAEKEQQPEQSHEEKMRQIEEEERQATKKAITDGLRELTKTLNAGAQKAQNARNQRVSPERPSTYQPTNPRSEIHAPPGPTMDDLSNSPLLSSGSTAPGPQPERNRNGRDDYGDYTQYVNRTAHCEDATRAVSVKSRLDKNGCGGGEVTGKLTNNSGRQVHCSWHFTRNGMIDPASGNSFDLSPGGSTSTYSCEHSTGDTIYYACSYNVDDVACANWDHDRSERK